MSAKPMGELDEHQQRSSTTNSQKRGGADSVQGITKRIQQTYQERLSVVGRELVDVIHKLPENPVLKQMTKDDASGDHVVDRITEIISQTVSNEQEAFIQQLLSQVEEKTRLIDNLRNTYEGNEEQIHSYATTSKKLEKKMRSYRQKLRQLNTERDEEKALHRKTRHDAKRYSDRLHVVNENNQELEHELKKLKDITEETTLELEDLSEEYDTIKNENTELQARLDETVEMLEKSEKERLEIRNMYMGVNEKIESIIRDEGSEYEGGQQRDGVAYLQRKMSDMKKNLRHAMEARRDSKGSYKKKLRSLEKAHVSKSSELQQANRIILKCQSKIEKYKERADDAVRQLKKSEKLFKREKQELESSLEREKKSLAELSREFQIKLDARSYENERALKATYDAKVLSLQKDLAEKDAALQKSNMQSMLEQQMASVQKSLQPEQIQRMLDAYENKVQHYQQEYMPKSQHETILRETQNLHRLELQKAADQHDMANRAERQRIEEEKNKEFNMTLTHIKQAIKSLETDLENEKRTTSRLKDQLEEANKNSHSLQLALQERENAKRTLLNQLDDAHNQSTKYQGHVAEEHEQRLEVQNKYESALSTIKQLESTLEQAALQKKSLAEVIELNKTEVNKLREKLTESSDHVAVMKQEKDQLQSELQTVIDDKSTLEQQVVSIINNVNPTQYIPLVSSPSLNRSFGGDQLMGTNLAAQLNRAILQMQEASQKQSMDSVEKLSTTLRQVDDNKRSQVQKLRRVEYQLKQRVASLREELHVMRQAVQTEMATVSHALVSLSNSVSRSVEDTELSSTERFSTLTTFHEGERDKIVSQYQKKIRDHQNEISLRVSNYEKRIASLENSQENHLDRIQELQSLRAQHELKLEQFKQVLRIISLHLDSFSSAQQEKILALDDTTQSTQAIEFLKNELSNFSSHARDKENQLNDVQSKLNITQQEVNTTVTQNTQLSEQLERLREENETIKGEKKTVTSHYEHELSSLMDEVQNLKSNYEQEITKKDEQRRTSMEGLRNEYRQRVEALSSQIHRQRERDMAAENQRKKIATELSKTRSQLSSALSEYTMQQQDEKMIELLREKQDQLQRSIQTHDDLMDHGDEIVGRLSSLLAKSANHPSESSSSATSQNESDLNLSQLDHSSRVPRH